MFPLLAVRKLILNLYYYNLRHHFSLFNYIVTTFRLERKARNADRIQSYVLSQLRDLYMLPVM